MTVSDHLDSLDGFWNLDVHTPLGAQPVRMRLERGPDDILTAAVETWDGWATVDLRSDGAGGIHFDATTEIFTFEYSLRPTDGRLDGSARIAPSQPATLQSIFGPTPVRGVRIDPVPSFKLAATSAITGAIETYHDTIRSRAALPGYTLYRPVGVDRTPAIVWGNGGARDSNEEFVTFLTQLASHGFAVIAPGEPQSRFTPMIGDPDPGTLTRALDWLQENGKEEGFDISRVVVMGQSAGSAQAWFAARHALVKGLVSLNGGSRIGGHDRDAVNAVTVPTLIVTGGTTDVGFHGSRMDYETIAAELPAVLADHSAAGHVGLLHGVNDPAAAQAGAPAIGQQAEVQLSNLTVHWLDYVLNDNRSATAYFAGPDPHLAQRRFWSIQSRNIRS